MTFSLVQAMVPASSGDPEDAGTTVPALARIVVPLDGSPPAERALPVAAWLARETGAPIHLLEVVPDTAGATGAIHDLADLARRCAAPTWEVAVGDDPGAAIAASVAADRPGIACMATHGRDRSAAVLGSVAGAVLDGGTEPVMLVGPKARPSCAGDAPVVTAVDGTNDGARVVAAGAAWAARLGRRLVVATVAEPVPSSFRPGHPMARSRGPGEPEAYLAGLAEAAAVAGPVETRVVYDPISVRGGLTGLIDRTAALLVIGAHRRVRPLRALLGSHAARVVHDCEVPALVVPLHAPG